MKACIMDKQSYDAVELSWKYTGESGYYAKIFVACRQDEGTRFKEWILCNTCENMTS